MNIHARKVLIAGSAGLSLAAVSLAGAQQAAGPKPEQSIRWRQSAFQVLAWNTTRIKSSLEGSYDKEQVAKAAGVIAAIANSGLGTLFPPGTESGRGWHNTNAKRELFANPTRVAALIADFTREANELSRVAGTGDAAAVKEQFAKLSKTCKGCHDTYRKD